MNLLNAIIKQDINKINDIIENCTINDLAENNDLGDALSWASYRGYYDVVIKLIEKGADVTYENASHITALACACTHLYFDDDIESKKLCKKAVQIANKLIEHGAPINTSNKKTSPLTYAIQSHNKAMIKLLVECGANMEYPLSLASNYKYNDVALYLICNGAKQTNEHSDFVKAIKWTKHNHKLCPKQMKNNIIIILMIHKKIEIHL